MVDVAQLLATYDALVGLALGASLTYGFGALKMPHPENGKTRQGGTKSDFALT